MFTDNHHNNNSNEAIMRSMRIMNLNYFKNFYFFITNMLLLLKMYIMSRNSLHVYMCLLYQRNGMVNTRIRSYHSDQVTTYMTHMSHYCSKCIYTRREFHRSVSVCKQAMIYSRTYQHHVILLLLHY